MVMTDASTLEGRYEPDPEGGAYVATSRHRDVPDDLAGRLRTVATDEGRLRELVELAKSHGVEFDD
ncbi:hypothetical protein [Couchioplanes caeruleus]|uniref:Uncharacterized protein n=2 Tax=Couchioplanes caeruleus TaxID=56438 RepID=A0A3N1GNZ5_9ACTN|nr:hypothetical protein [Couchioplanes caeruleus]ROP31963.1 hypothetical protein EDD30_4891 [Couchioplanes caeruleus]